jgi:hypothetical protein
VTSAARIEKGVLAFVLPPYALAVVEVGVTSPRRRRGDRGG